MLLRVIEPLNFSLLLVRLHDLETVVMVNILGDGTLGLLLFWFLVEFGVIKQNYLQKFGSLLSNRLFLLLNIFLLHLFFITFAILRNRVWIIDQSLDLFTHLLFVVVDLGKIDINLESFRNLVLFFEI